VSAPTLNEKVRDYITGQGVILKERLYVTLVLNGDRLGQLLALGGGALSGRGCRSLVMERRRETTARLVLIKGLIWGQAVRSKMRIEVGVEEQRVKIVKRNSYPG